jgi:valyl-tRNA synthetase
MLEKTYSPADIEARIARDWDAAGAFKAGAGARPAGGRNAPYAIVIPPPNVTGSLHMGHALNNTIQDILVRFERMRGRDVLWQPGTDHAGIATQMVVERKLASEKKPGRRELGREKFLETVWAWKQESGGTILNQLKRLGASCDWSRERFTMDEGLSKAVLEVFVALHGEGLIYRDKRLVNWDPKFQSAISDLEVVQKEINGSLWHFKYPLKDDPAKFIVVATTRPETMLGDLAVAVHPDDERLKHLVGKMCVLPLVGREIPIIADAYSDPEKGSGAVKITPAHDFNDFEVGERHDLGWINIFTPFAKLNENVPAAYRGLDRFEARKRVVADMESLGLLEKIEPHKHVVPHGDRSDVPIEPYLTTQWYADAARLAAPALAAVKSGKTTFVPERFANDYYRWLENIQPWCISRQLWWGHQIPAWYMPTLSKEGVADYSAEALTEVVAPDEAAAVAMIRQEFERLGYDKRILVLKSREECEDPASYKAANEVGVFRDPDVLDTWFSSALWPFSTLGWPEETPELARYYPTATLVTGFDIIFFWVARMMMMGVHFLKDVPFHTVYIHGLVRDASGQKMSKSKGNVLDPLGLIENYGADALRFSLAAMASQGADVKFSEQRVQGYRNFATKLWNAARFAEMNECVRQKNFAPHAVEHRLNRWIVGATARAAADVTAAVEAFKFNEAAAAIYAFTWDVFCDWYLELAKPIFAGSDDAAQAETRATTAWTIDQILKLLHPFMPFVTEELWGRMVEVGIERENLLCLSSWPEFSGLGDDEADAEIGWLVKLVSEIRSVRSEMNVPAGAKVPIVLVGAGDVTRARVDVHRDTIERLARADNVTFADVPPPGAAQMVVGEATACLPLAGVIDMAAERRRLAKGITDAQSDLAKMDAKLSNPSFMSRAKPEAIEEAQDRKAELLGEIAKLEAALRRVAAAG